MYDGQGIIRWRRLYYVFANKVIINSNTIHKSPFHIGFADQFLILNSKLQKATLPRYTDTSEVVICIYGSAIECFNDKQGKDSEMVAMKVRSDKTQYVCTCISA